MGRTKDALKILDRVTGNNTRLRRMITQETMNSRIAQLIYDARSQAGLTQAELAHLIGTKQAVIARLEDADYHGHSLAMLHRIATALNQKLDIRLLPEKRKHAA